MGSQRVRHNWATEQNQEGARHGAWHTMSTASNRARAKGLLLAKQAQISHKQQHTAQTLSPQVRKNKELNIYKSVLGIKRRRHTERKLRYSHSPGSNRKGPKTAGRPPAGEWIQPEKPAPPECTSSTPGLPHCLTRGPVSPMSLGCTDLTRVTLSLWPETSKLNSQQTTPQLRRGSQSRWCGVGSDCQQYSLFFFCPQHTVCRILVPRPGIESLPLGWKHGFLTSGPPGKSPLTAFY